MGQHFITFSAWILLAGALVITCQTPAQDTKPPSAEVVRELQSKFRREREALVKTGAARRFLPVLMEKAEEFGKRADAALAAGRLLQASELFRQARWQLPYQPPQVPDHVQRILGNMRLRHGQEINDVAFSPDGRRLASASKDRTVKIWDLENGHEQLTYLGHGDQVRVVAFSPDGKVIASAGAEPIIKLWDPVTGKDVRSIKGKGTYVTSIAFSRDGKHLVVSNDDKAVRLYETATGNLKREIGDFRLIVQKVVFNADGTILGAGVGDGQIRLWEYPKVVDNPNQPEYWARQDFAGASYDLAFSPDNQTMARVGPDGVKLYNTPLPRSPILVNAHRRIIPVPNPKNPFTCAVFSKDSQTLFTGSRDGIIRLWKVDSGDPAGTIEGHNGVIKALAFNPAGDLLASASADYTIRLHAFNIRLQAREFNGHQGPVWSAAFSPDGQRLVSAGSDKSVKIWDANSGKVLHSLAGHTSGVTVALFSPDGKTVVSGGGDKVLRLWDAGSGKPLAVCKGHEGTVTAVDFQPGGKRIVSGGADRRIKIWDTEGKEVLSITTPSVVAAVAFSPNGKQIASGHIDQSIRLWEAATGKPQRMWTAHGIAVTALSYSPNGQWLASAGADHLVKVWALASPGSAPILLSGHNGPLSTVAFHKDSQHLASAGSDTIIKLWKLESGTGKEVQNFSGHSDWVTSLAFSRDGYFLASASVDRTVKVWEITSREIPLLSEHTGAVYAVAASPDGKLIASGAGDKTIKLWDRASGAERLTLVGHKDDILFLAFTPDNKTLVSSSVDRSIRLWDVQSGKELPRRQTFIGLINPVPYFVISPDGKKLLTWVPGNERYTTITVFDLASGNELLTFNDSGRHVFAVAFMPDGSKVALGGKDGSIRLYDLEKKGQPLPGGDWFLFKKGTSLGDLAFTPDGKHLLVGNDAGDLTIAQVDGRKVLKTLKGHKQRIGVCLVSPDGKRCASAGFDNVVILWDIAAGKEIRRWDMHMLVQERSSFVMSMAFTPESRNLLTANANTTVYVLDLP